MATTVPAGGNSKSKRQPVTILYHNTIGACQGAKLRVGNYQMEVHYPVDGVRRAPFATGGTS